MPLSQTERHVYIAQEDAKEHLNSILLQQLLADLRDERTPQEEFKRILDLITLFLLVPAMRDLDYREEVIKTPMAEMHVGRLSNKIVAMPILRAGLGMEGAFTEVMPNRRITSLHLGLRRNEDTLKAEQYLWNEERARKNIDANTVVFILDPMLATGGSMNDAIELVKEYHPAQVRGVSVLASREGIQRVVNKNPDVPLTIAAVDDKLNNIGYIVPGLGDAGDRQFGT